MKFTADMLASEKHPLIEKQLMSMEFTKESERKMISAISTLQKFIVKVTCGPAFSALLQNMQIISRASIDIRNQ